MAYDIVDMINNPTVQKQQSTLTCRMCCSRAGLRAAGVALTPNRRNVAARTRPAAPYRDASIDRRFITKIATTLIIMYLFTHVEQLKIHTR